MSYETEIPPGVQIKTNFEESLDPGGRRPLVILNGIGAGTENWGNFIPALDRPVVAIDVSRAESCRDNPSMRDYAESLIDTIEALDYGQVDLLGVSWGGGLAQETVKRNVPRFGKLVLAATLHGRFSIPPKLVAIRALSSPDRSSEKFKQRAGKVYGGDIRGKSGLDILSKVGIERHVDDDAYRRQQLALLFWNNNLWSLRKITIPTLVIVGADDPVTRPINSRLMDKVLPESEIHIVPEDQGGGHLVLHTRPEESAAVINEFLDRGFRK